MEKFGKKCKQIMMTEMKAAMKGRPNIFITNYMGLSTGELESLRRDMDKMSAAYFIVKNSFTRKVFEELKYQDAVATIEGGVGLGLAGDDIVSAAKVLSKFAKEHDKLKIQAAILDGKFVPASRVKEIASLPAREVLLARIAGGMMAPITGFVMVLGGTLRKFVYCIGAIKRSKEAKAATEAKPAEAEAKPAAEEKPAEGETKPAAAEAKPATEEKPAA